MQKSGLFWRLERRSHAGIASRVDVFLLITAGLAIPCLSNMDSWWRLRWTPPKRRRRGRCPRSRAALARSAVTCIAHMEYNKESCTIDAIREQRPPFSPEQTCKEFAELMQSYGIGFCISDRYGGEWCVEQMGRYGIRVEQAAKPKSELYLDLLATLMSGRVELLDHPRSITQIASLERRNRSGGRASIDSPQGMHEDVANALAGVVSISLFKYGVYNLDSMGDGDDGNDTILAARRLRQAKADSHWPEFDTNGNPSVNYAFCWRD
jgi:hypothetical protein